MIERAGLHFIIVAQVVDWTAIFRDHGLLGVLALIAAQFAYTQFTNSRARTKMEDRAEERLNARHEAIVQLLNERLADKDAQISALQVQISALDKARLDAAKTVEDLSGQLEYTRTELATAKEQANLVPGLVDQVGNLKRQADQLSADLDIERNMRDKAEKRANSRKNELDRILDDNKHLLKANTRLGERLDAQRKDIGDLQAKNRTLMSQIETLETAFIRIESGDQDANENPDHPNDSG